MKYTCCQTSFFLASLLIALTWAVHADFTGIKLAISESPPSPCLRCHEAVGRPKISFLKEPRCRQCHALEDDPSATNLSSPMDKNPVTSKKITEKTPAQKPEGHLGSEILASRLGREVSEVPMTRQKMILVPAGEFIMGNDGRGTVDGPGDADEIPSHSVYVEAFYIDQYETTNAMYLEFTSETRHRIPRNWTGGEYPAGKANHPVIYVDWFDADQFCRWAGKRLPTEEEWEKAARGPDGRIFPWGSTYESGRANTPQYWLAKGVGEDDLGLKGDTLPVGSFENGRSPYGAYDMAGNVYEWTSSWYLPYPGNSEWNIHYGHKNKVLRGGSWYDCLSYGCGLSAPTYNRSRFNPKLRNMSFGFRCAKSAEAQPSNF